LRKMLDSHDQVDCTNNEGSTPLHLAAMWGHDEVMEALLQTPANTFNVNSKDRNGNTPLHLAAEWGHKGVVALLIANHADVNATNVFGFTPVNFAEANDSRKFNEQTLESHVQPIANGSNRDHDIAPLLRQHGGVANKEAELMALLWDAMRQDNLDGARDILRDHRELATYADGHGVTPLHLVSLWGFQDIAALLLTNNADVNAKDIAGDTPLRVAKFTRHQNVAGILQEHGGHE
jgi:ankyrin repeat protein